jgi:hypothetical protein
MCSAPCRSHTSAKQQGILGNCAHCATRSSVRNSVTPTGATACSAQAAASASADAGACAGAPRRSDCFARDSGASHASWVAPQARRWAPMVKLCMGPGVVHQAAAMLKFFACFTHIPFMACIAHISTEFTKFLDPDPVTFKTRCSQARRPARPGAPTGHIRRELSPHVHALP